MKTWIFPILLTAFFAGLLSLLPVYPLLMEGREISQSGESLYQEWRFVSILEYNASGVYARAAWQESVRIIYAVLMVVNYLTVLILSWLLALLTVTLTKKAYSSLAT